MESVKYGYTSTAATITTTLEFARLERARFAHVYEGKRLTGATGER